MREKGAFLVKCVTTWGFFFKSSSRRWFGIDGDHIVLRVRWRFFCVVDPSVFPLECERVLEAGAIVMHERTVTVTMTHSDEVTNGSQKPGPSDESAGVMTPHRKNLSSLYALLSRQGRLLVLCMRQCAESRVEKKPTGVWCDKFVRIQRGSHADTREFQDKIL